MEPGRDGPGSAGSGSTGRATGRGPSSAASATSSRARPSKADGDALQARVSLRGVWDGLIALNRNAELAPLLARRQGSEELSRRLFCSGVTTLTGRVRGRVSFTQARNTPFQGLAADGAKLALWELIRAGYRVVAFIHDEILIELPEDGRPRRRGASGSRPS